MNAFPDTHPAEETPARLLNELAGNSLHFPLANLLMETAAGGRAYLETPDAYILLAAGVLQGFVLSRWQAAGAAWRLIGNLIAPLVYTLTGLVLFGGGFFSAPNHIIYWVFALLWGSLQAIRPSLGGLARDLSLFGEDLSRACLPVAMIYFYTLKTDPLAGSFFGFITAPGGLLLALLFLSLGLYAGTLNLKGHQSLGLWRDALARLKTYSQWLFGRDTGWQVAEPRTAPQARRQTRTVLFMDIRGFTAWTESHPPAEVGSLLNRYYQSAEATLAQNNAIKFKFAADEVMAIFSSVDEGLQVALKLRLQINALLGRHGLGVGIGLHSGPIIEGLLGGKDVKFYEVVGETVSIARQIEAMAGVGEVLVSEDVRFVLGTTFRAGQKRQLAVKGRSAPVVVYPLE